MKSVDTQTVTYTSPKTVSDCNFSSTSRQSWAFININTYQITPKIIIIITGIKRWFNLEIILLLVITFRSACVALDTCNMSNNIVIDCDFLGTGKWLYDFFIIFINCLTCFIVLVHLYKQVSLLLVIYGL